MPHRLRWEIIAMNTSALASEGRTPESGLTYRMLAPSRADTPRIVRDWVVSILCSAGRPQLAERARLCASEVVTNAHRHTDTQEIVVEVALLGERVTVYVYDNEPERRPPGGNAGTMDTCGRGLMLVGAYADDRAVTAQGECSKAVWFSFVG
ncbi:MULTISPECIES: ATP-binding protein [unclassified Streptomyces]|uniref:ATP-binding protein n=1 Tax=unclassified Streptomyces TaxID=2593676 RepID=UPI000DC7942C|nr:MULTISPECIES: ATP-binding protein [unclassified Streptomyces]AWZ04937.1 ATP-binding protein [Streptomyces sp. ICC4]AWZ13385.1 ATP-binding protein [Streptomyces sp. ICC1]